ncbi:hypothetical protein [Streptomyces vietnamensis]|uniref:hypothetical protein n=1 Tax=Streptomyces vietnamensis TaxID=362257 RepID=UPI003416EAEC
MRADELPGLSDDEYAHATTSGVGHRRAGVTATLRKGSVIGFEVDEDLPGREARPEQVPSARSGGRGGSLPILEIPGFRTATVLVQFMAVFGSFFVGLQYLQLILGYSPLKAAVALAPCPSSSCPPSTSPPASSPDSAPKP